MKEATIENATLNSIRVIAEGDLTRKWKEEDRVLLDDDKLSFGGLDIEKDGRSYWCDTSIDDIHYDELRNHTVIDLELWDDPDAMPDSKQDLTERDLFLDPEFYLWMEYETELPPKYSIRVELGDDDSNVEKEIIMIHIDENQQRVNYE